MPYGISIEEVPSRILAATRARANSLTLGTLLGQLLPAVWQFVKENDLSNTGQSVVVYQGEEGDDIFSDEGMPIVVGAEVSGSFENTDTIRHFAIPGGEVAHTLHIGPYQQLPQAHDAVRQWCRENGHELNGLCWEIYSHHQDPARQETQVCYLLR